MAHNIKFIVFGFAFVIIVLLTLAAITQLVGLAFKQPEKPKPAPVAKAPAPAAEAAPVPAEDEMDSALTAVIVAAAVHAVIGDQPHRILSIRPSQSGWAQEGRRQIFSSHSVR
ncbi:OadG family transporter subunit [Cerasicoccus maritimus]|uniref:OadG family transporter subunit n=1 Tax=Cerasicoccus maritimus TaxID=490089 RepID=UPI0028524BFD|nr:OadG family transporter subunit [Cerasicoccus maritimus]